MAGKDRPPRKPRQQRTDGTPTSKTPGVYCDKHGQWWATIGSGRNRVTVRAPQANNTEAEARRIRKELEQRSKDHVDLKAGRMPFDTCATEWLERQAKKNLKIKTLQFYREQVGYYLIEFFGSSRIHKIGPRDVDALLDEYRDDLSPRSLRHVYATGKAIFKDAVRRRYIGVNPFDAVDPPPLIAHERPSLDDSQLAALWDQVRDHRYALLYVLLGLYGLRRGEVLGLRVADYDDRKRTLTIAQQVVDLSGKATIQTPKTRRSLRTLPVPPWIADLIDARIAVLDGERGGAKKWTEHGLIVPSEVGTPIGPRNFGHHFQEACGRAGLSGFGLHSLRHTAASRLDQAGASQATVAGVLGHALPGVTGGYTHAVIESMRPAVEAAADRLRALLEADESEQELRRLG